MTKQIDCEINSCTFEEIWKHYKKLSFIYDKKRELLNPILPQVEQTWNKLLKNNGEIFQLLTIELPENIFATGCIWRNTTNGWFVQHGISNSIIGILLIMLNEQKILMDLSTLQSVQVWFQPTNKTVNKVCNYAIQDINPNLYSIETIDYLLWKPFKKSDKNKLPTEEFSINHRVLFDEFIKRNKGNAFFYGEELNETDIELGFLNEVYQKYNLVRNRKAILIFDKSKNLTAIIIIYIGPIGLNYSLLENRCEVIIDNQNSQLIPEIYFTINDIIKEYANPKLVSIPIITDKNTSKQLTLVGAKFIRSYTRHIWLRPCFKQWYNNYLNAFNKIIKRHLNCLEKDF